MPKHHTTDFGKTANMITHNGKTLSVSQWAKIYNIPVSTLNSRMKRGGMTFEEAVTFEPNPTQAKKLDDPAELRRLLTEINVSVAHRIRLNIKSLHDWIDTTMATDPAKVAKVVESLASVLGSVTKAAPPKENKPAASINISLNTNPKPEPKARPSIEYTEAIDADHSITISEERVEDDES